MRHYPTVLALAVLAFLSACQSTEVIADESEYVEVVARVDGLNRGNRAPYRYYGSAKIQSPQAYRGIDASLLVISFDEDVTPFNGRPIQVRILANELERDLRPTPYPFSIAEPSPQLLLEYSNGAFEDFNFPHYSSNWIAVAAVIRSIDSDSLDSMYFIFDQGFIGKMVNAEIMTPEKFRGTVFRILARDLTDPRWEDFGRTITFESTESDVMLQPWGFAPDIQIPSLNLGPAIVEE